MVFLLFGCNNTETGKKPDVKNIILIVANRSTLEDLEKNKTLEELSNASRFKLPFMAGNLDTSQSVFLNFSAVAIGKECKNNSIGLDAEGVAHPNLIELASVKGMSTGLITSGSIVDPIPASFIAHLNNKNQYESIALEYLNSPVDFISGYGLMYFNKRMDGINLVQQLGNKGFSVYNEINKVNVSKKTAILFDDFYPATKNHVLQKSTVLALQSLTENPSGFFLMIDGTNILSQTLNEKTMGKRQKSDFNHSVETAFDFASQNPGTFVIVTSGCFAANSEKSIQKPKPLEITTTIQPDSISIYTFGYKSELFNNISESTEIFDKIVHHLNLNMPVVIN
jgi:alkaline phosphatase